MDIQLKSKWAMLFLLPMAFGITLNNFPLPERQYFPEEETFSSSLPQTLVQKTDRYGRLTNAPHKADVFSLTPWGELGFPTIDEELELALRNQLRVLEKLNIKDGQQVGNLRLTYLQLRQTLEILLERVTTDPGSLSQYLDAWQVSGKDGKGNSYFTGYFTPIVKVSSHPTSVYKYPLYAYPKVLAAEAPLPSRADIDGGEALDGLGLELAYAAHPLDIYTMQLQGSGYVHFVDNGSQQLFRYAGENRHSYRNIQHFFTGRDDISIGNLSLAGIGHYLQNHPDMTDSVLFFNPSYTFFQPASGLAKGAADVPLMEGISVAADTHYFPLGSVLLAAFPVVENGVVKRHEFKLLLPQDTGGAIRGAGHLDVYSGTGQKAQRNASALHHYGQVWLLIPRQEDKIAMNG